MNDNARKKAYERILEMEDMKAYEKADEKNDKNDKASTHEFDKLLRSFDDNENDKIEEEELEKMFAEIYRTFLCKKPVGLEWERFKEHYLERLFDKDYHELCNRFEIFIIFKVKIKTINDSTF